MSDYDNPIEEHERRWRILAGICTVAVILAWIVAATTSSSLWFMVSLSAIAAIILTEIIVALWFYHTDKKQYTVKRYLVNSTRRIFFYGFPLADCLQSGVSQGLCWHRVGDFSKQIGSLVLVALKDSERDPIMYYQFQEDARPVERYAVLIHFFYDGSWWQLDICERLDQQYIKRIRSRKKRNEALKGWGNVSLWRMGRPTRRMFEACTDSASSKLAAEAWFTDEIADSYDIAYEITEKIIKVWRICVEKVDTVQTKKYRSWVLS